MFYNRNSLPTRLRNNFKLWSLPLALMMLTERAIAQAQVVPDNTLPNNSIVTPNGDAIEITGGSTSGNNLFHSFEQFSVLNGQTAFFDNGASIENIISRVTGSSISEINGLIQANDAANLFLINPNGIVFGENSALDIGGSFIATTADSLKFADSSEFSAVNPTSPLLTVSIPVGLQLGNNSGDITVKGTGHDAFFSFDTFTVDRFDRNLGLEVAEGNTLGLIGNNITLEGGNLTAVAGNVELVSIAEAGTVDLATSNLGFTFDSGTLKGGEINLSDLASIDVSGNGSGNMQIKGDSVNLTDGSAIFAETEGDGTGGLTTVSANRLNIIGSDPDEFIPSSIWSDVDLGATGDGGSVVINSDSLLLQDGGQVNVNTYGLGNAGDLTVKATDIQAIGESPLFGDFTSGLYAQADIFQTGSGGNILVETDSLLVKDGAQINTSTFGDGDAGSLTIVANDVKLIGNLEDRPSGLFANAEYVGFDGVGKGGNLNLTTNRLLVSDGAQISTTGNNLGDAGNLSITATEIELTGSSEFGSSSLFAITEFIGNGGDLDITANNVIVSDGAEIAATTLSEGNAGEINIEADSLVLADASLAANTEGEGNGGSISIDTEQLQVTEGGQIAVVTFDSGNAGILDITASSVELDGSSDFASSGLFSSALEGSGNGGDLNLESDRLSITNGATINAGNFSSNNSDLLPGTGETGSINIDVNSLKLDSSNAEQISSITASANTQAGGDITLNVANVAEISNQSQITAETLGEGQGGNINFVSDRLKLTDRGQISVNSNGTGNAGDIAIAASSFDLNRGQVTATATEAGGGEITLTTDSLFLTDSSLISTSVLDSDGGGGNITIDNTDFIVGKNNSQIEADAVFGDGGRITIDTTGLFFDGSSKITASSQFGIDGVVEINNIESEKKLSTLQLANTVESPQAIVSSNCPVSKNNTFAITGRGGMPHNPGQYLPGEAVWQDIRIPTVSRSAAKVAGYSPRTTIIEAQTWQIDRLGNVELLAQTPKSERLGHEFQCSASVD